MTAMKAIILVDKLVRSAMAENIETISVLFANAVRDAYEAGLRDGRLETLDEAAKATAELGSLGRFPSGRKRPAIADLPIVQSKNGGGE